MAQHPTPRGMRLFTFIWFGQIISLIGSGLTGFALGIWVYQRTGSATNLALIELFATIPCIAISPLAGALVDRCHRRFCMIVSDSGAAVSIVAIALLLAIHRLEMWHLYLLTAISYTFHAFQLPAYTAATTQLVPSQHLDRASGMIQLGQAIGQLLSPVLGGLLVVTIQLQGVILLDFASFLCALLTLLLVRFPKIKTTGAEKLRKGSLLSEVAYGFSYITKRPGLLGLLIFLAASNFLLGTVSVLTTPLVLSFTSPAVLGIILSCGGIGMVVGSLIVGTWRGGQHRINRVFGFMLLCGLCILVAGLRPSAPLFATTTFFFLLSLPLISGSAVVIFQKKVPLSIQGRVFALNTALAGASLPLGYALAGPLADRIFEPLMASNSPLAGSIGQIIGVGPGRGTPLSTLLPRKIKI
ncbi:MAG: MFS transporter [Iphinoe sp. HA4291-MV1]|nr:MFS transporter [Iphinoe sp. HA4291-MV1]